MKTKNIVIAGASSGIGAALAIKYAQEGWNVGLIGRNEPRLNKIAKKCRSHSIIATIVSADVCDLEQIIAAVTRIETTNGQTYLCIAAAGISKPCSDVSNMEDTRSIYETNLIGVLNCFHAVLPGMKKTRAGCLVAISSLAAFRGLPSYGAYCGSKQALNIHCESLRADLKKYPIAVTVVHPGFVQTPMTEHLNPPKFLSVSAQTAAKKITRAINRGHQNYSFPFMATLLSRLGRWMPSSSIEHLTKQFYTANK